jgi:hypothetical protein
VVAGAWLADERVLLLSLLAESGKKQSGFKVLESSSLWSHSDPKLNPLWLKSVEFKLIPTPLLEAAREASLQEALQEQLLREEILWKQKSRELVAYVH